MRISLEKIEFRYDEHSFNIHLFVPGEKYARWLYLNWQQWQFVCQAMDRQSELKIGDFAITDGVNRLIEFFSDAIRVYDLSNGGSFGDIVNTFPFPFEILRQAIDERKEAITPEEIKAIRWKYWPKSKVVWTDNLNREVLWQVRKQVLPFVARLRNIAKNHSDGQLCVVHMYSDGMKGQTLERLEAGEMPSFYWEIFRFVPQKTQPIREQSFYSHRYLVYMDKVYIVDTSIVGGSKEYPVYGRIMNGGLIWHGQKSGYSIHT